MIGTSTMASTPRAWRAWLPAALGLVLLAGSPALGGDPACAQAAPDPVDSTGAAAPAVDSTAPAPAPVGTPAQAVTPNPQVRVRALKIRLIGESRNVVRTGPGERYAIAGMFEKGVIFTVIAKSGPWYNIRLSDTETGWIHSALCQEFDDLSDLEFRPNPKLYTRTGSYVLSGYAGGYAFDRKSNSLVVGGRLGYYIFDRVQADMGLAWTHISRPREIVESLFGLTLEAEEFHMLFYSLNLTWEVLPGRQMVPFVTGGVGSAIMQGEVEPSFNFGAGTTLFLSKRVATRWEVRNYRLHSGAGTSRVTNDNIEFTLGTVYLF